MENGLIHIYCGDGKGKTTCAAGLALRCAGADGKVLWFQFMKKDTSSERKTLSRLENIELISGYDKMKFSFKMNESEKNDATYFFSEKLKEIDKMVREKEYDLLILDEILGAISSGMLEEKAVMDFLKNKPNGLEVVLTGRNPSEKLCEMADYISEIKKIKHPYDKGILARRMIEY